MKANECMQVLAKHRGDAVVVCALGMAANEWWAVTKSEDSFYMHGGMGLASTFALGLAIAIPDTPVWVINSDGGLCMNTGTLLTEAGQQQRNMKHFVVDNQCYQTVETMPMVNQDGADYTGKCRRLSPRLVRISFDCGSKLSLTISARPRPPTRGRN